MNQLRPLLDQHIERYNEMQDRRKLNLVVYDELIRNLLRIMRAVTIYGGHLIIVGLRGFATGELIKLASFCSAKQFTPLEINPDFKDYDWCETLKSYVMCAGAEDKQLCVVIDEHRITNQEWYRDIETIMRCSHITEVLGEDDIIKLLCASEKMMKRGGS
jgi:hypothetical protein